MEELIYKIFAYILVYSFVIIFVAYAFAPVIAIILVAIEKISIYIRRSG